VLLTGAWLCPAGDPHSTGSLSIDRALQPPLAAAKGLIERGQYAEAIRSLQPILGDSQNSLVFIDGRYIDAKVAANRLIASFPSEARAIYEREFGGLANRELERAKAAGRLEQVLAVGATYRETEAGRHALATAAGLFFDGGQFFEAAAIAEQLLEMPGTVEEPAAAARLVTAWLKLGRIDAARQWVEKRHEILARQNIEIEGIRHPLDQWLSEQFRVYAGHAPTKEPPINGGHPQLVGSGPFERPSVRTLWKKRFEASGVVASLAEELISRRVESGIPPVFHSVPLVVGQTLVTRRNEGLAAYDLLSGESRWSADLSASEGASIDSETLADRTFSGGPQCAISTDGERVFSVVEDGTAYVRPVFTPRGRRMSVELPPKNSLSAYDLRSGKKRWQLTEIQPLAPSAGPQQADRDIDFLGPPLACDKTLFVMGRTNEGSNLLALDPADGTVRWGKSLAGFSGFEADLVSSFGPSCVPVERNGLLICPTPEGIVVAFDLATRSCRWAYRAQPAEEPSRLPPRWGRRFAAREAHWLTAWRENLVRLDDRRCFYVSPRSPGIHALAIDTGEILWTQPVTNGLFLGPIIEGRLLAFCQYRVLAFDAATGRLLWSSAIGLPSGRGFAVNGHYLLPQASGGLAAIDVTTGAVDFPFPHETVSLGNLVPVVDAVGGAAAVSQSADQLALVASLDRLRADAAENLRRHPADSDMLRPVAQLEREAGNFERAEQLYGMLLESDAHEESVVAAPSRVHTTRKVTSLEHEPQRTPPPQKSKAELLLMEEDGRERLTVADRREFFETLIADFERNPQRSIQWSPQLLRAATGDDERALALRSVGTAISGQGQKLLGLHAFLELSRLELPRQIEVERGPRRLVAFDRQLAADLKDLLHACSPAERQQADKRIQLALERTIEQGDVVLFGRVFKRLRSVGLDRSLRRKIDAALGPDAAFSQTQLELWDATTGSDTQRAADAWRDLAELCRAHGNRRQAAFCYRRLAAEFSHVRFDDGLGPADLIASAKDDRPLLREIEEGGSDPWPTKMPEAATDETDAGSTTQFAHLPVEIMPGSLCERLDVAIDQQGETLRFQGNGHSTYWDVRLPGDNSHFQGMIIPLHRAWGIGQLVVVQLGTDLFGVSPLDEEGEPVASVLWHVDLLNSPLASGADIDVRFLPGALAPGGERIVIADRLGRPAARVGPVRPGYVCYQDRGNLIALDPLSGRILWRRTDIPAADLTSGDDASILLLDRRSKRLQLVRALDGKTLAERMISTASDVRWLEGLDAVTQVIQSHRLQLSRIDLTNGRVKWTQSFPSETELVRMDGRRYLAAESGGTFHVVETERGTVVASHRLAEVKHCLQVHVTSDERRFYVAFSGIFADTRNFRANGQRDELRNPLVSGALCAVDRRSGQLLWERPFLDAVFNLDQSRVAPMLVFSYRRLRRAGGDDDDNGMPSPILHCIDKRTGRDVFKGRFGTSQPISRNLAETELGRREVIIRWPDSSIRFRYTR
jgi:outer membrane protein assembly factor BamB